MDELTRALVIIIILAIIYLLYINYFSNNTQSTQNTDSISEPFDNVNVSDLTPSMVALDNAISNKFINPQDMNINKYTDELGTEQNTLDSLMQQINQGSSFIVNSPEGNDFRKKALSKNSSKEYKNISYKDSKYRHDFGNDAESQLSQDELNNIYSDALVFKNNENLNNNEFKGYAEYDDHFGDANIGNYSNKPQTQQEKVMSLYDSNAYLPNANATNKNLEKGFQILNNPVAVSNPNLIPVLKSIPVSTTLGSNRNMSYDIRNEPACPKVVVSPFLNSSINPDIYSQNRGCLA
jgi:hypothetical protein